MMKSSGVHLKETKSSTSRLWMTKETSSSSTIWNSFLCKNLKGTPEEKTRQDQKQMTLRTALGSTWCPTGKSRSQRINLSRDFKSSRFWQNKCRTRCHSLNRSTSRRDNPNRRLFRTLWSQCNRKDRQGERVKCRMMTYYKFQRPLRTWIPCKTSFSRTMGLQWVARLRTKIVIKLPSAILNLKQTKSQLLHSRSYSAICQSPWSKVSGKSIRSTRRRMILNPTRAVSKMKRRKRPWASREAAASAKVMRSPSWPVWTLIS